jgi:hypothetical protein
MSSPLNRLHVPLPLKSSVLLTAACLCLAAPQLGCENASGKADKTVEAQVDESRGQRTASGELPAVPASLTSAANNTQASPATRAETLALLGQSEVQRAAALLGRADREEVAARRVIAEINRLGARLQSNNVVVAGLQKLEPTPERTALQEHRGAVQGEKDTTWIKHETGSLPALKGVEERLTKLQDDIAKLEEQSKNLAGQRSRLIAEAERLERESEGVESKRSVELFNQSANARKKAADLGVQVDVIQAKLVPLRQDQQLALSEQQLLNKAVQAFDARLQGTEENWKLVQKQIDDLQAASKALVGPVPNEPAAPPAEFASAAGGAAGAQPEAEGAAVPAAAATPARGPTTRPSAARAGGAAPAGPAVPVSLAGKLRWLSSLTKSIETQRGDAEALLTSALSHYTAAGTAASSLAADLQKQMGVAGANQRPEMPSWKRLSELHNTSEYRLKQAAAHLMLAGLQRDRASLLAARSSTAKAIAPAIQAAKVAAPLELAEQNVEAEVAKARDASAASYKEADELLNGIVEAKNNDAMIRAAKAAHELRLASLYGQAQLAAGYKPDLAAQLMKQAKQVAAQGMETVEVAPTALPAFLQDVLEIRPATPATAPARTAATATPATATPAPAPGTSTPAPGTETPAPGTETPAPEQPAPAPDTAAPAPAEGQPAPAEGQQPAPAEGQQPAAPGADTAAKQPDAGAQPAGAEQPAADQPPAQEPPAEQPPAEQPPAEQPADQKAPADK